MTKAQRSASGGGVGSSDFCIRAELAQGRVHATARYVRAAYRRWDTPEYRYNDLGFRPARVLD